MLSTFRTFFFNKVEVGKSGTPVLFPPLIGLAVTKQNCTINVCLKRPRFVKIPYCIERKDQNPCLVCLYASLQELLYLLVSNSMLDESVTVNLVYALTFVKISEWPNNCKLTP